MIPGLVVLYILLIGVAAWGSWWSFRIRKRHGWPFLRTYHLFILLSFAYAIVNFIGEVFAPAILQGPTGPLVRAYMIVDLVTIPLLGGLFFLIFLWITQLLARPVPTALKAAFVGLEVLFLAVFITAFLSYFDRGVSAVSLAGTYLLDGIVLLVLAAAVLALVFAAPAGDDPFRRRLARGLGIVYAVSLPVLVVFQVLSRTAMIRDPAIARVLPAGLMFLVNLPALFFLRASLRALPPHREPAVSDAEGLAGLARDARISDRELEIIRLLAMGLDNREIGKRLFISPKTVKNHITSIYAKTGVRNRVQLVNLLRSPRGDSGT